MNQVGPVEVHCKANSIDEFLNHFCCPANNNVEGVSPKKYMLNNKVEETLRRIKCFLKEDEPKRLFM